MKQQAWTPSILVLPILMLGTSLLTGCGPAMAPRPTLINIQQPQAASAVGQVLIGIFLDERSHPEMGQSYFGTIRGGYGNPIERLQLEKPVVEAISEVITNGLRNAGYRTDLAPSALQVKYSGRWIVSNADALQTNGPLIVGRVSDYQASNNPWTFPAGSRSIQLQVEVCILDPKQNATLWCDAIRGSDRNTEHVGVSGNAAVMGPWLNRLAEDQFKDLLAKTSIAQLWKEHLSDRSTAKAEVNPNTIDGRLGELNRLREKKLITEEEYNSKRKELIRGL